MKKLVSILLAAALILVFASCENTNSAEQKTTTVEILADDQVPDAKDLVPENFIDPVEDWYIYDDIIEQAKTESDMATRTALLYVAESLLISTYCITPLYNNNRCYLKKDYVSNVYGDNFGCVIFTRASMENGEDTLRVCVGKSIKSLDPHLMDTTLDCEFDYLLHGSLYRIDQNGSYVEDLAKSMEISDDGLTYTVKLKDNIKWSDGSPITASDFVYSWNRAIDPVTAASYEYFLSVFDGYDEGKLNVTAVDDKTLVFVLNAPCPYIKSLLANPVTMVIKQDEIEKYDGWESSPGKWCEKEGFTAAGPFVVTEWKKDCYMVLEKNPYYWDAENISLNRIEVMLTDDEVSSYTAYSAGDIDLTTVLSKDELSGILESGSSECYIGSEFGIYYSVFNVHSDIFEGKTAEEACCMRMAISMLTDREYICNSVLYSLGTPVSHFVPIGMTDGNGGIFHDEDDADCYFDPVAISKDKEAVQAKARMYLQAAGFKFNDDGKLSEETPLNFEMYVFSATGIPEALQQDFAALGIETTIKTQNSTMIYKALSEGDFVYTYTAWFADYNDPLCMLELFTTGNDNGYAQFGTK